jgi:uncharacterized protein with von Willebrand factor type A (vWA) domain
MGKFLDRFIQNTNPSADPDAKFVFEHDKWDRKMADKIEREIADYRLAADSLKDITHTGYEAMVDTVFSLFKAAPSLRPQQEIRPSYLIDHKIMDEMVELKEYEKLRPSAKGDPVNAGLAAIDMEPTLEKLFDKLEKERQIAQSIEQMLQDGEATEQQLEEMIQAAAAAEGEQEAQNFQDQIEKLQEHLEALQNQIEQQTEDLNNLLEMQGPTIKQDLKEALDDLNEKAKSESAFVSWGLNQGSLAKLDPSARIALSKKLGSEKFKKLADIIGKMQTLAITQQVNKANYTPEEVYDVELGDALHRLLPAEYLNLLDPTLQLDWFRRYTEHNLQQYALKGNESVDKGSIILLEDGSGSMMHNDGYIWAKAVGLALLKIAFMQHRGCYGVQFGGPGKYITFDFNTESSVLGLDVRHNSQVVHYDGVQALVEYADKFLNNAGTCFMTPFSVAIDKMQQEFDEKGVTESDIVFLTDGQAAVTPAWLKEFKEAQEKLDFKVYGIAIGGTPQSEPIQMLCDGKVISLAQLTSSKTNSLASLFGSI